MGIALWLQFHQIEVLMLSGLNFITKIASLQRTATPKILITGDSLIAGLTRYSNIGEKYFVTFNMLNSGIRGDHIENVI